VLAGKGNEEVGKVSNMTCFLGISSLSSLAITNRSSSSDTKLLNTEEKS